MEVGLLQNFCEILYCPETHEAAIVDPAWEVDRLLNEAGRRGLKVTTVLVTHTHNDHIEGVDLVVEKTGAAVVVNPREAAAVTAPGRKMIDAVDGRAIAMGKRGLRALETPGHTVGGTCYLADGYVVTGDVLFVGGCGRTDFTGGDSAADVAEPAAPHAPARADARLPGARLRRHADLDHRARDPKQPVLALRDVRGVPRAARAQAKLRSRAGRRAGSA